MRGFIQGVVWGLILGGGGLATASYLTDDTRGAASGPSPVAAMPAAVASAAEAPFVQATAPDSFSLPAATDLPRMPALARAPFVDNWVPVLTNIARMPELPLLDGNSTPPEPAPAPAAEEVAVAPEPALVAVPVTTPEPTSVPEPEPVLEAAPKPEPEPLPEVDTSDAPVAEPEPAPVIAELQDNSAAPTQSEAASSGTAVVVNRLGTGTTETPGQVAEVIPETEELPEDAPALMRYAATFENPEDVPVLAIILMDTGDIADPVAAVADLGFAPTVVVNALAPDAANRLAAYRAAGAEVAMELALPTGAVPADVEVAFEAALGLMPEAAMLFSAGGDVIQGQRQVTTQVMQVLGARGMGFVAEERGLGGAIRTAEQFGVAAASIARDLDGGGDSAAAIGRSFDQAAFRARQTGDAVLLARITPQTLAVLRDWAAANAGGGTVIGPASAVLLGSN